METSLYTLDAITDVNCNNLILYLEEGESYYIDISLPDNNLHYLYLNINLTDEQIWNYIETKQPLDKAGAYGIQGGAALFCTRLVGDYYNVMGLPVCRLGEVLRQLAPQWMGEYL